MSELSDLNKQIATETEACAFNKKRSGTFLNQVGHFFTAQRKYEPDCEIKVRAKYADQLKKAQEKQYTQDDAITKLFKDQANGIDKNTLLVLGGGLLLVIIVLWMFS